MISKKKKKVFTKIARDFPAEIGNLSNFSGRIQVISKKKRFLSTKNTNLDLDLRSKNPESVNFFGAQSSLGGKQFLFGGHKQSVGGARPRYAPRGAGSFWPTLRKIQRSPIQGKQKISFFSNLFGLHSKVAVEYRTQKSLVNRTKKKQQKRNIAQ